jgi:L-ascorbate metabolism protein UlaG (beta-lactamase superfamily)
MARAVRFLAIFVIVAATWLAYRVTDRPSLEPFLKRTLAASRAQPEPGRLHATFFGVSTILFDDRETAILIDGFFSRPSLLRTLATRIAPDDAAITQALARAGIGKLAAVVVAHSHYDHAMDAPEVARRTGAVVVGSESTANIARGAGLGEDSIHVVRDGERLTFGRLAVTAIESVHFPHGLSMGEITAPLVPPVRAANYLDGGSYSLLIEHEADTALVQASAGFVAGALAGKHADVVFLGIAGLSTRDDLYRATYWREVVAAVGAKRVIPIHWDDFTLPLDRPLEPLPKLLDDIPLAMSFIVARGKDAGIDVALAPVMQPFDPFAALARQR